MNYNKVAALLLYTIGAYQVHGQVTELCFAEGFIGDSVQVFHNGQSVFHEPVLSMNSDQFTACVNINLEASDFQIIEVRIGDYSEINLSQESKILRKNVILLDVNISRNEMLPQPYAISTSVRTLSKKRLNW